MTSNKRDQKVKPPEPPLKTGIDASKPTALPEIHPDDIPIRLKEDIRGWKMEADKYKEYFMEKGINPFLEAHEILLSFLNNFDNGAGMKAK